MQLLPASNRLPAWACQPGEWTSFPCFTTGLQLDVVAMLHATARAAAPPLAAGPRRESSRGPRTATPCGLLQKPVATTSEPRHLMDGDGAASYGQPCLHTVRVPPRRETSTCRRRQLAEPGAGGPTTVASPEFRGTALRSEEGVGDGEVEARGMRRRELWWP